MQGKAEPAAIGDSHTTPLVALRRFSPISPRIVAIGASTGGPQALAAVLQTLAPYADSVPIVIVLHMPNDFAGVVSGYIERLTQRHTRIAANGEILEAGRIYIAPGNVHLGVMRAQSGNFLNYVDGPPENFCKPAVDVLFRTVAKAFGPAGLGLVLSGMGNDGLEGARAIVDAGGSIIVQDAETSVVWGMPGAVATAGLASAVLPLDQIGMLTANLIRGFKSRMRA